MCYGGDGPALRLLLSADSLSAHPFVQTPNLRMPVSLTRSVHAYRRCTQASIPPAIHAFPDTHSLTHARTHTPYCSRTTTAATTSDLTITRDRYFTYPRAGMDVPLDERENLIRHFGEHIDELFPPK